VDEEIIRIARELLGEYGRDLAGDPDRLGQLLESRGGRNRREVFLLVVALREAREYPGGGEADWAERLSDDLGRSARAAAWAARAAAILLGRGEAQAEGEPTGSGTAGASGAEGKPEEQEPRFAARPGNLPGGEALPLSRVRPSRGRDPEVRKALAGGVALLLIAVLLVAVGFKILADRRPDGGEYRIALLAPLSGPQARTGQILLKAAQLAVDQANAAGGVRGCRIRLVGFDAPSPRVARESTEKALASLHPTLVVHAGDDQDMEGVAETVERERVPLISVRAGGRGVARAPDGRARLYSFLLGPSYGGEGKMLAYFAIQGLGRRSAALLTDLDDPYSEEVTRSFETFYRIFGGTVVARIGYRGTEDFRPALAAIRESRPELLLLPVSGADAARIAVQARVQGIVVPILSGRGLPEALASPERGGLEGSWWILPAAAGDPGLLPFYRAYRDKYRESCPREDAPLAVRTYDAIKWAEDALRRARGPRGEDVRRALSATESLPLLHATLTIDPATRAPRNKAMALVRISGGVPRFQRRFRP